MSSLAEFWSAPFTRSGRSALVPRGPWTYCMTGVGVYYKADADRLREAVPKPLEVDDGSVFAYVTEIVSWSPNAPDLNVECPDLVQYGEAAFFVRVRYRGRAYSYCPYMWVDNDLPLLRGLLAGWPKKYAKVAVTRLHPMMEGLDRP
ncbi:TPA: acetoacetate decarboxylase, partial [Candidatus Micrarchaeota archaeon]|nr:acetoacetate decarboxylase [Candidatus Micrarchaeota archaeon]